MPANTANNLIIPGAGLVSLGPPVIAAQSCPFDITLSSTGGSNLMAYLAYGSVSSIIPSNIDTGLTLLNTGLYYVKLVTTTNGGVISQVTIVIDTNIPKAQTPTAGALPSTVEILIFVINNGIPYRTIGCGSIMLTGALAFTTDKPSAVPPGVSTSINYYIWQVNSA